MVDRVRTVGAIGLVASAALFLANSALELRAGPPPSDGVAILAWRDAQTLPLSLICEVLFFAIAALVPGGVALYRRIGERRPATAVMGCGAIAMAIAITSVALVVEGRLVYPIFGIKTHTPETAELVVSLYFGALHAAALFFAIAAFMVAIGVQREHRGLAVLGYATCAAEIAAGYPDAIGPAGAFACGAVFAAWLAALGLWLRRGAR